MAAVYKAQRIGGAAVFSSDAPTVDALTAQALNTGAPTISQPTLTAAASFDVLTAQDIAAGPPTISTPGIAQIHVLTGQGVVTGGATVTRAVLVGDIPDYTPSIYIATSPAMNYLSTSPVQSYLAIAHA